MLQSVIGIPKRATRLVGKVWSFRFEARTAPRATILLRINSIQLGFKFLVLSLKKTRAWQLTEARATR